jgi:hypothetical protein
MIPAIRNDDTKSKQYIPMGQFARGHRPFLRGRRLHGWRGSFHGPFDKEVVAADRVCFPELLLAAPVVSLLSQAGMPVSACLTELQAWLALCLRLGRCGCLGQGGAGLLRPGFR